VKLCKLLFEKHWKKNVRFVDAKDEKFIEDIKGTTAGLIIGDRALAFRDKTTYIYDLGSGWREMTGLPFVFAVWVSIKHIPDDFKILFSQSSLVGFDNLSAIISDYNHSPYDLFKYYNNNISYILDLNKKKGLTNFLKMI
jgi:chorismate dehydratase